MGSIINFPAFIEILNFLFFALNVNVRNIFWPGLIKKKDYYVQLVIPLKENSWVIRIQGWVTGFGLGLVLLIILWRKGRLIYYFNA
jgi:hypothetical protein